jgi:hypothetical protein
MISRGFLTFIAFLVLVGLTLGPYARFIVQREGLDNDLGRVSLEYTTSGKMRFVEVIERICKDSRLNPGDYELYLSEDKRNGRVLVEIRYEAKFKILFFDVSRPAVVRKEFDFVDI